MEKINTKTFGKLLKSIRRNTLFEQIVNNDIKIKDLAKATGISSDRLYRIFDIPTVEELDKIQYEITKVSIISKQNELAELARLGYHIQNPTENAMMDDNEHLITRAIEQVNAASYDIQVQELFFSSRVNNQTVSSSEAVRRIGENPPSEQKEVAFFQGNFIETK